MVMGGVVLAAKRRHARVSDIVGGGQRAVGVTLCIPLLLRLLMFQKAACSFDLNANVQSAHGFAV